MREEDNHMSVQFGRWSFAGLPLADKYIEDISATIAPYGPDSSYFYSKDGVRILYRGFHTTKESHGEKQPTISDSGCVITWDGRLDNREDLIKELRNSLTAVSSDVSIAAAAYDKWGTECFQQLIGDWAISIWNPRNRSLLLAKDFLGTRQLYYTVDEDGVVWCTVLDPLVLFRDKPLALCEEYVASWLGTGFPAVHLTPFVGIHAVLPSSLVLLTPTRQIVRKYWDLDGRRSIRYRTDREYEEHFRFVFSQAVQRRLRSDRPVLAELSGGMDSSSIVCMADSIIAHGEGQCPGVETISWYDDSYDHIEKDSNELHWIAKVEEKRRTIGFHMHSREIRLRETSLQKYLGCEFENDGFAVSPIVTARRTEHFKQYAEYARTRGIRVTLSGLGGELATGGSTPSPTPELQNLLVRARLTMLFRQLKAWAVKMKKPQLVLLWEALRGFTPAGLVSTQTQNYPAIWLDAAFAARNSASLCQRRSRIRLFGHLPSFQVQHEGLNDERKLINYLVPQSHLLHEIRLPYLDRSLFEFMYAIPWDQIVRAGQRRWLMKRALKGILPDQLLTRRRKEFSSPTEKRDWADWANSSEFTKPMLSSSLGFTEPIRFFEALQAARSSEAIPPEALRRTLVFEFWLRHLVDHKVLWNPEETKDEDSHASASTRGVQPAATPFKVSAS